MTTEVEAETGSRLGAPPRGAWLAAGALTAVLAAFGGRFGFHRDELYFVEAGRHPAWGFPDQPPLVPLLANAWYSVTGGGLWAFRLVPALLAGAVVLVAALTAGELGGGRREQVAGAVTVAVTAAVVAVGHLFSTTTFDLLGSSAVVLLLLRALRAPSLRGWLAAGLVAGVTMQVKTLVALLLLSVLVAWLLAGPRRQLRTPGPLLAALLAAAIGSPYLVWQAAHGWPQLEVAGSIAAGGSVSSTSRALIVPEQLLIVGPIVGVVLVVGLVVLLRSAAHRWVAVAYLVLTAIVIVTGGKSYYMAGLAVALLAAGGAAVARWTAGSRPRRAVVGVLLAAHLAGTAFISLPVAPPGSALTGIAIAANPDAGETIGWDEFVATVGRAARERGAEAVLTRNYGEAGALDEARRRGADLPPVSSVHNAYGEWGPPDARDVLVVGRFPEPDLRELLLVCNPPLGTIGNAAGVENEEWGAPLRMCTASSGWREWDDARRLG